MHTTPAPSLAVVPRPGLAFGEPDDRLQRGIQYAAASRIHHRSLWNAGSPASAGDDDLLLPQPALMLALEPADVLLGVKLQPDPPDQVELGFEEVDVVLLVLHQAFEQVARDIVPDLVAIGRRFLIQRAGADLGG